MAETEQLNGHLSGEISVTSHPVRNGVLIRVSGEIDLATAGTVERELLRAEQSHRLVVLDLSDTSFMDSTGVHIIVSADRRLRAQEGRLVLVHGPPPVQRLLTLTGVADHVELVYDPADLDCAVATGTPPTASRSSERYLVA